VPTASWWSDGGFEFRELVQLARSKSVDVAVGCLGSGAPELDPRHELPTITRLLIDLGTPRNFAPTATVPSLNITDLLTERSHSQAHRDKLAARLRAILERRLGLATEDRATPVGAMRASVEAVRQRELARTRDLHPEIPPDTLDTITRSLVNQIFHLPSQRLREIDDQQLSDRVAALFAHTRVEAQ
jgi:glutamyl-tRNA reductase